MQIAENKGSLHAQVSILVEHAPACAAAIIDVLQVAAYNTTTQLQPDTLYWLMEMLGQLQLSNNQVSFIETSVKKGDIPRQ